MPITPLFNVQSFERSLGNEITKGMLEAAEPILQEALREIERKMREKLAAMVVGRIESSYDLVNNGTTLTIRVQLGKDAK